MSVNEKTLELNITHEILRIIHRFDPHAFAFGTTLRQERQGGYDSRVLSSLPGFWRTAVFQYKRPYESEPNQQGDITYWFHINNNTYSDQHQMLQHLSGGAHNVAFYVFPAFIDLTELRRHTPHLLDRTFVVDAMDIPLGLVGNNPHNVELIPDLLVARVHSDEIPLKVQALENLIAAFQKRTIGLSIESLLANLLKKTKG